MARSCKEARPDRAGFLFGEARDEWWHGRAPWHGVPVPKCCPWFGRKLAREIKGDVFEGVCGLVFGMVFEGGSKLRRVAKALIPLDIPHLALGKENGVEILNVKQKPKTKR